MFLDPLYNPFIKLPSLRKLNILANPSYLKSNTKTWLRLKSNQKLHQLHCIFFLARVNHPLSVVMLDNGDRITLSFALIPSLSVLGQKQQMLAECFKIVLPFNLSSIKSQIEFYDFLCTQFTCKL